MIAMAKQAQASTSKQTAPCWAPTRGEHTHAPCRHCHGSGKCGLAFCPICADPRHDDLPFACGTCLVCVGEGIDFEREHFWVREVKS